jgi:uncharacterized membrane protein YfcA
MDYLIGFGIAVLIALSGVGAGVVTAPVLILIGLPIDVAITTALAYSALVKLIVVPFQVARKQVNYRVLGFMLLGGLPGVILGSLLFKRATSHGPDSSLNLALNLALGLIIVFTASWHLYRHFRPMGPSRPPKDRLGAVTALMLPIGAGVGFSSSGAGALGTVMLLSLTSLSTAQVVGTDLAFGLGITLVGSGIHLLSGKFAGALLLRMVAGGILGGVFGSWIAPKIPNRWLRFGLSLWLIFIGAKLCWDAFPK